jgi:hypothetical protein
MHREVLMDRSLKSCMDISRALRFAMEIQDSCVRHACALLDTKNGVPPSEGKKPALGDFEWLFKRDVSGSLSLKEDINLILLCDRHESRDHNRSRFLIGYRYSPRDDWIGEDWV